MHSQPPKQRPTRTAFRAEETPPHIMAELAKDCRAAILLAILLGGCAPHVRFVSTYCIGKDAQIPAEPPRIKSQLTGKADSDLRIVAGSAIRLRSWGEGLSAILEGCREPAK